MSRYYMLNKPKGYITACSDERQQFVMSLFPKNERAGLFPVGRLDKDTEGFLLITDDGKISYHLMNPENKIEKTYFVWAKGTLTKEEVKALEQGVNLMDGKGTVSAPAKISLLKYAEQKDISALLSHNDSKKGIRRAKLPVTALHITITEGKKHEVKKMLRAVHSKVLYLKRISIAGVSLDSELLPGEYRELTDSEVGILKLNN